MKPEAKLSQALAEQMKLLKSVVFATRIESSQTCPGLPDWMFVAVGGKTAFVELKAGASLTPAQKIIRHQFKTLSIPYVLLTQLKNSVRLSLVDQQVFFPTLTDAVEYIMTEILYGQD